MKINICFLFYFFNFYTADYIINDSSLFYNADIQDLNTENSYLENNIIVNNVVCSPSSEYDDLLLFIFNLPNIDNPSFFLVINNNQLYQKSNLNKKFYKTDILNNNLIVNTILSNSINSNINNLTIIGDSVYCGNSKSETLLTGSLITINALGIYTNKFNTNIRSSHDIIFEKSLEVKSKFSINDIQASDITINYDAARLNKNVSFSNTVNLGCNDITIAGGIIFNDDLIINSNNCFLFTTFLASPINFLIIDSENKVFQTTKIPTNKNYYFIDNLIPSNPENTDLLINVEGNEFKMIGDGTFYCSNEFKCYDFSSFSIGDLEIKDIYYPLYNSSLTINKNMQIKKIIPQGYHSGFLDENSVNIINFNIPFITISGILNNGFCSTFNSQCIFKNINMVEYSLGPIIWKEKKFPGDFKDTFQILTYALWNNVITKDIINFLKYIDYKKNCDNKSKKTYINILIKKIFDLLYLIKNNIHQDSTDIKIQLNKIMEQL